MAVNNFIAECLNVRASVAIIIICVTCRSFKQDQLDEESDVYEMGDDEESDVFEMGDDEESDVYEMGDKVYTSEGILQMLLNPKGKICKGRPTTVNQSASYIVDLKSLDHPDDIRIDEYGKWKYSGSHVHHFRAERILDEDDDDDGNLVFERVPANTSGSNVYKLRRIHCKHPSNPSFQRLIAFVTGELSLVAKYMNNLIFFRSAG